MRKLTVPFGDELVDIDEQREQHVRQVEARLVAVQRDEHRALERLEQERELAFLHQLLEVLLAEDLMERLLLITHAEPEPLPDSGKYINLYN